ncbi:putative mucin-associated surface protein (MASP) [Trypanosoma cruzi]|uniref:Mucin-associated surface protein (MASP), putative n=2 Tax=Trypanosoma cruzi TaxID=5693 RepID=Q4E5J9_TRYCC|nr:mucin-associated surface protein (MASP), putative [Trypanosoma cruzi]EAO00061.1 mucin-associated surface protein (MASP), putative [Trypanosoma cruzi]PWV06141.1 putative mucin-associated surface protein (MASP) [Trypanosoma cruzi]|eukprot:XP_821912.1 mucin-associated surface protein (MASP) [Trypanosoma cruzi strain CL Brener]
MAMMMTGRVLLVCALCVLWCGAADGDVVGPVTSGDPGGGQSPLADGSHGGSGGKKADISHESKSEPLVAASGEESPTVRIGPDGVSSLSEEHLRPEKRTSNGKQEESQSPPQDASPTKVNPAEALDFLPQERLLGTPEKEVITNGGGGGTANGGKEDTDQNAGLSPDSSDSSVPPVPQVNHVLPPAEPSPAMTVSAEETNSPALTGSQHATERTSTTSPSHSKTAPGAPEKSSGNGEPNQHREDSETPGSMKDGPTSHPAETPAPLVSTSGSDGAQKKEDKVDNSDQRPNNKEPQYGHEDGNTEDAPTANETAPQTAKTITTQKNVTSKPGDSDGSTAVSHITSPLSLLFVVACAAAAVMAVPAWSVVR